VGARTDLKQQLDFSPLLCTLSSLGEGRVKWIWPVQVVVTNWESVLCWEWPVGPETWFNCLWWPAWCG